MPDIQSLSLIAYQRSWTSPARFKPQLKISQCLDYLSIRLYDYNNDNNDNDNDGHNDDDDDDDDDDTNDNISYGLLIGEQSVARNAVYPNERQDASIKLIRAKS